MSCSSILHTIGNHVISPGINPKFTNNDNQKGFKTSSAIIIHAAFIAARNRLGLKCIKLDT